jgi:hypothetical protein
MKKRQSVIFIAFLSIFTLVLGGCGSAPNKPADPNAGSEAKDVATQNTPANPNASGQTTNTKNGQNSAPQTPPPDGGGTPVGFTEAKTNLTYALDKVAVLAVSSEQSLTVVSEKIGNAKLEVEDAEKQTGNEAIVRKLREAVTTIGDAETEIQKLKSANTTAGVSKFLNDAKKIIEKNIASLKSPSQPKNNEPEASVKVGKPIPSAQTESTISYVIIALSIISLIATGGCIWLLFDSKKSISELSKKMSADNTQFSSKISALLQDNIRPFKESLTEIIKDQVSTLSSARQLSVNNASQNISESRENQNLRDELTQAKSKIQSLITEKDTLVEGKNELERRIQSRESQLGQEAKDHVEREIAKYSAIIDSLRQELEKATVSSISSERIPEIPISPESLRRLIENLKSSPATQVSNVEGSSLNEKIATQTKQLETSYRSAMNGDTSAAKRLLEEIPLRPYEYSPELWSDSIAAKNKLEIARNLATKLLEKHGYKLIQPIPGVDAYSMQWHDERDQIITFDSRLIGKVAVVRTAGLEFGGEIIKKAFIAQYVQGTGTPPPSSVAPDYSRPAEASPSEASQPTNTVVNTVASGSSIENPSDTNRTSGIGATGESSSDNANDSQQHKSTSAPNGQSAFPPSGHQVPYDTQKSDGEEPVQ